MHMREEYQHGAEEILEGYSSSYSIGVAVKEEGMTYRQLYKKADEALYQAKKQGKDRLCLSR